MQLTDTRSVNPLPQVFQVSLLSSSGGSEISDVYGVANVTIFEDKTVKRVWKVYEALQQVRLQVACLTRLRINHSINRKRLLVVCTSWLQDFFGKFSLQNISLLLLKQKQIRIEKRATIIARIFDEAFRVSRHPCLLKSLF